ncbi:DNA topoisomerase [Macleaya cordata]|uniref:DNA topoisomerase n=1 Tax=Macleaya cordata TaxID=56857 RepID=A0A200PZI2_MACCD|nr:DNA topoisomerase [Macleaya cordata]
MSGGGRTIRVLNVAEKPSVAKAVSGILSRNQGLRVREGRSRYNKIFEFEYTIRGQPCNMAVTSVTGHLMELEFEDRYRKWNSCDPVDLYQAVVRKLVPQDKLDIKRTLEEEARRCQWLVLWLDCDREGENIAFEVIEVCTAVNPNLNIWRARFSALIERDIHESVQNLVRPNQLFADAVDARQEIDLRIGASFTRFQTMLLKDAFVLDGSGNDVRNMVLSYGPCQFPTLGFIVERYWEIQAHEPEEFWTINCTHTSEDGTATFNWMRGHMFDYSCAVIIYEMCVQEPTATVTKVRDQQKLKQPPYPLNTIELEKRASRYFRMSSEHTMKVAEDLYQAGFISYPRTETDSFSERTDLHAIVQEQQGHPVWGSYAQQLLDPGAGLWRNPSNGGHDDKAHPPIHPTKFSAGESGWSQDHNRVYELVVRHFLACVSQPAVGAETTVEIDIAGELFSVSGRMIIARNYLDVYRFESWGGSVIPKYLFGQQFTPTTLTLDSGVTRPPPLLSEADLLTCMDKAGIGTDATMHDHIKKLLDRFYATKDANTRFSPTNLGEALVMGYDDMGYKLWKPYLRSMMECDMKAVSLGTKRKSEVLETCLQQMKACFLDARLQKVKLLEAMAIFFDRSNRSSGDEQHVGGEVVRQCAVCQESDMVLKRKPDGNFMVGCLGYPQCRNVVWLPASISEATVTTQVCNSCNPGPVFMIQFKFRQMEIPPNYNVNHLGCIGGCDETLRQLREICGTGSRSSSSIPARGHGPTASSNTTQRPSTRQGTCTHCRQTGHSSNDCPSQTLHSQSVQSRARNFQSGEPSVMCTTCGAACPLREANTTNNRGRKFYSCQSRDCNFFVWADNVNSSTGAEDMSSSRPATSNSSSGARRGSRGRGRSSGRGGGRSSRAAAGRASTTGGTFVSATGEPISGRRCFVCGDPSHFANNCPSRGAT